MATLRDVAYKTGYSIASVSAAFRRPRQLSKLTREKILAVARELGYFPGLNTNQNIGIYFNNFYNHFYGEYFSDIIFGVLQRLAELKLRVQIFEDIPENYSDICEISGFILIGKTPPPVLERAVKHKIHFLKACCPEYCLDTSRIYFDNKKGVGELVQYAINAGHKYFAVLNGEANLEHPIWLNFYSAVEDTLLKNKINPNKYLKVYQADYSNIQTAEIAVNKIFSEKPKPTMIFCTNDLLAYYCYLVFKKHGIKVPADISISGFDGINIPRFLEKPTPELATIVTNRIDLGKKAVDFLLDILQKQSKEAKEILLPTELRIGASIKRLKSSEK